MTKKSDMASVMFLMGLFTIILITLTIDVIRMLELSVEYLIGILIVGYISVLLVYRKYKIKN